MPAGCERRAHRRCLRDLPARVHGRAGQEGDPARAGVFGGRRLEVDREGPYCCLSGWRNAVHQGATSLFSTVEDLGLWIAEIEGGSGTSGSMLVLCIVNHV